MSQWKWSFSLFSWLLIFNFLLLQLNLPYVDVLHKSRYVGRTFIQPCTKTRKKGVAQKFAAITENVRGQRVVLVDDSVVRGTTIGPIVKLLRNAGAKEVCEQI